MYGYWGGGWDVLYDKINWESPMTLTILIKLKIENLYIITAYLIRH